MTQLPPPDTAPPPPGGLQPLAAPNHPPPPPPPNDRYPVRFDVDYPERLSRWKTLLRLFLLIPAGIFAAILGTVQSYGLLAAWIAVFLRRRYPVWLFTAMTGVAGFQARLWSYGALLTDRYPSFSPEGSPVHLQFDEPPHGRLSRWRVLLWKLVLLIPHFVAVWFLALAVFVVVILAWFAILFTGHYPRGLFGFVTGVSRWYWRVFAYLASFTDRFPPYSLSPDAGSAEKASTVASGVTGGALTAGLTAAIVAGIIYASGFRTETVTYADLAEGAADTELYILGQVDGGEILFQLTRVHDPGNDLLAILELEENERAIVFEWFIGAIDTEVDISSSSARLDYRDDDDRATAGSLFIVLGDVVAPVHIDPGVITTIRAVFVIPEDARPLELRWRPGFGRGFKYEFE